VRILHLPNQVKCIFSLPLFFYLINLLFHMLFSINIPHLYWNCSNFSSILHNIWLACSCYELLVLIPSFLCLSHQFLLCHGDSNPILDMLLQVMSNIQMQSFLKLPLPNSKLPRKAVLSFHLPDQVSYAFSHPMLLHSFYLIHPHFFILFHSYH
jgi:hypothetical protein